jgi:hypothetical protein
LALGLLRLGNDFANIPIKQNQLAVDGNRRPELGGADANLEVCKKIGVARGKRGGKFAAVPKALRQFCCFVLFRHAKSPSIALFATILGCSRNIRHVAIFRSY